MRKNEALVFGIFNTIYLITGCLIAKLVDYLVIRAVERFVPLSYHDAAVLSVVCVSALSLVFVGFMTYRDGHRYAAFDAATAWLAAGGAAGIHFLLGLATRFTPLLGGPTRHLSGLITDGSFYNSVEKTKAIPFGMLALVGICMMLVYATVMVLAAYVGCRRRLCSRNELTNTTVAPK